MTGKVRSDNKNRKVAQKKGREREVGEMGKHVTRCVCVCVYGEVSAQLTICRSIFSAYNYLLPWYHVSQQ